MNVFIKGFGQLLLYLILQQRAILWARDSNTSACITFRQLPSICDGCGVQFSIEHAFNCSIGGWLVVDIMRFGKLLVTLLL